jgi:predicted ribosome quality control (RQC) complex YloA/Tae2 family protein
MAVDGLSLYAIKEELKELLIGSRVQKSYQPSKEQLIINLYNKGENFKLLVNSNAEDYRVHITKESFDNPYKAPMFCMLLRKHIDGGRVIDIKQPGLERVMEIIIESRDELGNLTLKSLLVELMGKHSNIILLEESNKKIIDAVTRVPFGMSSVRQILPGLTYQAPPSDKIDIFDDGKFKISDPQRDFVSYYEGISPFIAKELLFRFNTFDKSLEELRKIVANKVFEPSITYVKHKSYCGALKYTHLSNSFEEFGSINNAFDSFYKKKLEDKILNTKKISLLSVVRSEIKKVDKILYKQKKQYYDSLKADEYKQKADLIKANLYQIQEGEKEVTVIDYYDESMPEITIELNPNKSPQRNLKEFYKKYEKAIRTQKMLVKFIKKHESELDYLESISQSIELCDDIFALSEIEKELIDSKYIKEKSTKTSQNKPHESKSSEPRTFSKNGFTVEVGRNNKQNDYLTLRKANKEDIWLHTKDIPGSHVVIRSNGLEVDDETLLYAANLAAFYSKANKSSNVPVDYTEVKNVFKQKGAHPGQVFYTDQKTIFITPKEIE